MQEHNRIIRILEVVLAIALPASLIYAGSRVYRSLPKAHAVQVQVNDATANSELTIVWRDSLTGSDARVELYPIDFAALENDFRLNVRPGKSIEEYLAQRLKNLTPVNVRVNPNGRAVTKLSPGNWWLRATSLSPNGELVEWRVPVLISQRSYTIELSKDNAYERAKRF